MLYVEITGDKNSEQGPSGRGDTAGAKPTDWTKPWVSPDFDKEFEGMEPTPQKAEDELLDYYESETPEGKQVEALRSEMDEEDDAKITESADALYKSTGMAGAGPDEKAYDYQGMVRSGASITPNEEDGGINLPNAHIRKNTTEIYGYDLSTGDKVRTRLPDPDGLVEEGVKQLQGSQTNTKLGAPIEDTSALTKIGVGHVRNGGSYEDFKANLPDTFTEDQVAMSYRVATDYVDREDMTKYLDDDTVPPPEDMPLPTWDLNDEDLKGNDLWMNSARIMYRNLEGEEFTGEDSELYELSLEMMSQFGWNAFKMAYLTQQVMNGPDDMKRAMYAMMKMYESKDTTSGDVINNLLSIGTDPMSYMSLGFGKIGVKGAQMVASKALSKTLEKFAFAATTGAAEGAVFTGLDDFSKQMVEVEAGAKKKYDGWQTAQSAAVGAAAGTVMGPAFVFGGEKAINYGKNLAGRVRKMRAEGNTRTSGPISRQRGSAGFDEPTTVDDVQGKGVSNISRIDQEAPIFVPDALAVEAPSKQVGAQLQKWSEDALQGRDVTKNTPENVEFIAKVMTREAEAQILTDRQNGLKDNAGEWYRKTLDDARAVLGKQYPEVVSDSRHRSAFDFALAITSNGQAVDANWKYGVKVYEYWRDTGRMPTSKAYGNGREASAMVGAFDTYNRLLDAWGEEALLKNLATEFTVAYMRKAGFDVADELGTAKLPLSVMFGSKVGGGFYSNLQGDWSRLTPDRWFSRTWGRYTGTVMEKFDSPKAISHREEFRKLYVSNKKLIESYLGKGNVPRVGDLTDKKIDELGQQIFKGWSGASYPDKANPMHKLARAIESRVSPRAGPKNGEEKQMMRDTTARAVEMLRDRGHADLTVSGLQAILWYPEQRYWDQLGSKQIGKEDNYANAARKYAGLPADTDGAGRAGEASQAGREPSLDDAERGGFLTTEIARNLRVGPRGRSNGRPPGPVYTGTSRLSGGERVGEAGVAASHVVRGNKQKLGTGGGKKIKDDTQTPKPAFKAANITDEPWLELKKGPESDAEFNKSILAAKAKAKGKLGQAVYVYDVAGENSLETADKYLTADGLSGFAIKNDGDIVSVFNASDRPNAGLAALMLAVEKGGTKLDAFDTGLGRIYARAGFVVKCRQKWNEAYKPDKWDKKFWGRKVPRGEPDIIYMEYEPNSSGYYKKGSGEYR